MTSVGVRELRQRASELLRRVQAGETIEVTDRGRPVAVLAPLQGRGPLERMRATGDIVAAAAPFEPIPDPLGVEADQSTASEVLARLRRDER